MWTAESGKPVGRGEVRPEGPERVGRIRAKMGKAGCVCGRATWKERGGGRRGTKHVLEMQGGGWWGTRDLKPGVGV